jgi:hypothetical protein
MRITRQDSIGLVIDIQERLLPHIYEYEALLKRTNVLIQGLKILDIPLKITEQYPKGLGPTVDSISTLISDFSPNEKMTFSCCDSSEFARELEKSSRKNIIICGIEAHVCVLQTCIDLLQTGYQPVVIADAISSRNNDDKKIAIHRMRQEGAIISTTESILFELVRISGTSEFKEISRLVK